MTSDVSPRFVFADFELDLQLCELRRAGCPVRIQPKAWKLLRYLIEHRDRVVSTEELLEALWREERVTQGSVKRAVREVRRVVRDSGTHQLVIRSIRGFGYRFVAPVSVAPRFVLMARRTPTGSSSACFTPERHANGDPSCC